MGGTDPLAPHRARGPLPPHDLAQERRHAACGPAGAPDPAAALILGHFALAATGLVLWIVYVASDSDALAWIAFALLLVVALLGFTMLAAWLAQRGGATAAETADAAERRFPPAVVGLHGVLAATTLVLVFLATIGVGD